MNTLRIKLNPYKDVNIASLDDKPLSPYSELNNYMKEPFLKWADKILDAAEREINDDFQLIISGEGFETKLLKDMQKDCEACKSYSNEAYALNHSASERYDLIKELAAKYDIRLDEKKYRMPVYSQIPLKADESLICTASPQEAFLLVTADPQFCQQIASVERAAIVILLSDHSAVTSLGDMKYQWQIEEDRLEDIVREMTNRFVIIPMIIQAAKQLESISDRLTPEDKEKLSLATEIDMFVTVADIEEIEVGKSVELAAKTIPAGRCVPALRVESSNTGVLIAEGTTLKALAPGKVTLEIYKANELIPFARKQVNVTQHHFAEKITLGAQVAKMGIGKSQKIEICFTPEDAEDRDQVKWKSDQENILTVDQEGNLTAVSEGRARITVSTTITSQSIEIEVLPNLSTISLSRKNVKLFVGQTEPMEVTVSPSNAYEASCEWKSSNSEVAVIDRTEDGSLVVRATGIGECILTCQATEGDAAATCAVKVESTFKKREDQHNYLSYTAIGTVACLVCTMLSFELGIVITAAFSLCAGVIAVKKQPKDIFWVGLLLLFTAMLSLGAVENMFFSGR